MAPHPQDAPHAPETLLASVLASSLDGIMAFRSIRADGVVVDFEWLLVNPRAEQIVGRPAAELVGRRLLEEMPGNREAGLFDLYVGVVESDTPAQHVFFYDAEGVRAWFQITAVPLADGFAVTFRDITTQKEAEEVRLALGRAQMAIFDLDVASGTISESISFDQIFGFPPDRRRRTLADIWQHTHPDDLPGLQAAHQALMAGTDEQYIEHRVVRPDGSVRWVAVRGQPVAPHGGAPTQIHSLMFDITERKEAEEAERQAREAAEEALALRDQFLNTASHELKTPLTALLGHTQLLARRLARAGSLAQRDERTMGHIVQQSQRLNRLVSTMLDVARLQTGRLQLALAPTVLQQVVADAVAELANELSGRTLDMQLPDEELVVLGDSARLCQAISNLLHNAAIYSPAEAPIRLVLAREGDTARLEVIDLGVGIPASALPHIFTRFYRASNVDANRGVSGMGVGLYLTWEIVTRLQGQIGVTSEEGSGSVFTVRLPLLGSGERRAEERQ
jgi:PAS domain S-box-containing protein